MWATVGNRATGSHEDAQEELRVVVWRNTHFFEIGVRASGAMLELGLRWKRRDEVCVLIQSREI